jgi:hypothetical protein
MRQKGVEIDRRVLKETFGYRGLLVVLDVTDHGLRRPCKVARLMQGEVIRSEPKDVHRLGQRKSYDFFRLRAPA